MSFPDKHGIGFDEYRQHLPASVHDWPRAGVVKSRASLGDFASRWDFCWACGRRERGKNREGLAIHHIEGGRKGRSDELTVLSSLCEYPYGNTCHDAVKTGRLPQGMILWLKWHFDQHETDWVRLAILRRSFLPDLVPMENSHSRRA